MRTSRGIHFLEGLVITQKESERARETHELKMKDGETCQDTERKRPREEHLRTRERRRRDLSEHGKKALA